MIIKKLTMMMLVVFTTFNLIHAQSVGTPNGNTAFFNTNAQGKLLGHRQAGAFGAFGGSDKWIGIGQPISSAYGFRVQANGNAGILALTNTGSNKKLELNWGGPGKTANFEINHLTSFTDPSGKINRLTLKTNGNLGLGFTAPQTKLEVKGTVRATSTTTRNNRTEIGHNGNSFINAVGVGKLYFRHEGVNKMTILPNGNVGIGATNPGGKLTVNSSNGQRGIESVNPNGNSHFPWSNGWSYLSGKGIIFRTNGNTERMRITTGGNVGIGTTDPGSYKLRVNGTAYATGHWVSSDKRYKKDVKSITNAMDKIEAIEGVAYKYKKETINGIDFSQLKSGKTLGFIAQDIERVFPELVEKDEDGYYAVNYDGMIPVLVEGMKEQQQVITDQKEEIADLQSRMEKLEALLNASEAIQGSLSTPTENIVEGVVVLRQNAPNPFSNSTTIQYQLPERLASASLVISDLNGRTISTYTISGKGNIQFNAGGLDNGIYTYAIIANGQSIAVEKMVIQK